MKWGSGDIQRHVVISLDIQVTGHLEVRRAIVRRFFSINITVQSDRHTRTRPTHTSQITFSRAAGGLGLSADRRMLNSHGGAGLLENLLEARHLLTRLGGGHGRLPPWHAERRRTQVHAAQRAALLVAAARVGSRAIEEHRKDRCRRAWARLATRSEKAPATGAAGG